MPDSFANSGIQPQKQYRSMISHSGLVHMCHFYDIILTPTGYLLETLPILKLWCFWKICWSSSWTVLGASTKVLFQLSLFSRLYRWRKAYFSKYFEIMSTDFSDQKVFTLRWTLFLMSSPSFTRLTVKYPRMYEVRLFSNWFITDSTMNPPPSRTYPEMRLKSKVLLQCSVDGAYSHHHEGPGLEHMSTEPELLLSLS